MGARYATQTIDLTSAGSVIIDGPWALIRLLDAVDGTGTVAATTLLSVKAELNGQAAPLRLGQGFLARDTRRFYVSWAAQSGIVVTLGLSDDPALVDWASVPPVVKNVGTLDLSKAGTLTFGGVTSVNPGANQTIYNASSTRRKVFLQNLSTCCTFSIGPGGPGGYYLAPGETLTLDTTAQIIAYNQGSQNATILYMQTAD